MKPARAVEPPYGTFSKADWAKIKQRLADIGVDLDTARISAHFEGQYQRPLRGAKPKVYRYSTRNHPWLAAGPEWRLSEVLQRLAYFYALSEPKTPKQWAKKLERALTATEKVLKELRIVRLAPVNYPDNAMRSDATKDRALYDLMTWKADELRERIAKLRVIDSRGQSALTVQGKYWRELTDLWRALAGPGKPPPKKRLDQFLAACSRPLNMSEGGIKPFLTHVRLRKRRAKSDRRLRTSARV
jgi:hypothetical protein